MADVMAREATASITAQNTGTTGEAFGGKNGPEFNVSLSGTWVATVHLQKSYDAGVTFLDVDSFTVNTEATGEDQEDGVYYRLFVKTGNFTSGTVEMRLSQSNR